MPLYLLSYDIAEKNHDYQSLWAYLEEANAVKILYSEWAVPFKGTASELTKAAMTHIEKGDKIYCTELFSGAVSARSLREITH
jgi:hypothetical protein